VAGPEEAPRIENDPARPRCVITGFAPEMPALRH
jgi:hypothetical protein